ncbi:MAG: two component transcriptional regulator, winged helix family [Chloroflexi bacterium]|jgi:CheY-like chemotaxis protein|nr:two component transcriptional regulator, winged helix family [Chloroflexota bacterium]
MTKGLVLVVDDDPDIIEVVRVALEDEGYQVLAAVNGAALPIARERHPNVILLDIMMPGMDGIEVSRMLRADPRTADIPIIAMSAHDRLRSIGAKMAVNDGLPKPFMLNQLFEKVAHWMESAGAGAKDQ